MSRRPQPRTTYHGGPWREPPPYERDHMLAFTEHVPPAEAERLEQQRRRRYERQVQQNLAQDPYYYNRPPTPPSPNYPTVDGRSPFGPGGPQAFFANRTSAGYESNSPPPDIPYFTNYTASCVPSQPVTRGPFGYFNTNALDPNSATDMMCPQYNPNHPGYSDPWNGSRHSNRDAFESQQFIDDTWRAAQKEIDLKRHQRGARPRDPSTVFWSPPLGVPASQLDWPVDVISLSFVFNTLYLTDYTAT